MLDWHPVCPTACCVAGNIVVQHGDTIVAPAMCAPRTWWSPPRSAWIEDGHVHRIGHRARELADISIA